MLSLISMFHSNVLSVKQKILSQEVIFANRLPMQCNKIANIDVYFTKLKISDSKNDFRKQLNVSTILPPSNTPLLFISNF